MRNIFIKWFLMIGTLSFNLISFAQQNTGDLSHLDQLNLSGILNFQQQSSSSNNVTDAQIRKKLMSYIWPYEDKKESILLETIYYANDTFLIDLYDISNQQKYKTAYIQGNWRVGKGRVCEIYRSSSISSIVDGKENCYKFQG